MCCVCVVCVLCVVLFFLQAEDGIRDLVRSRGLGDVYKRQVAIRVWMNGIRTDAGVSPAASGAELLGDLKEECPIVEQVGDAGPHCGEGDQQHHAEEYVRIHQTLSLIHI